MLWNAKMRFGKTLCALRVARDLEMRRTIILTHRPVVDESWFEDFGKIFYDRTDYHYGSRIKGETLLPLNGWQKKETGMSILPQCRICAVPSWSWKI